MITRLHISIRGAVQGVGFRPFVYRLAKEMNLKGWVLNSSQGVLIEVEGESPEPDLFATRLVMEKPPLSYIQHMETSLLDPVGFKDFEIRESDESGSKTALVLPDIATCPECLSEIFDPINRRYLYPFTNCTNCGPRFSIIRSLPYDRLNTTMAGFEMCDECSREYHDPANRRFHAQPNACPNCGPHLELWDNAGRVTETHHNALLQAAEAIREGKTVALKGIGGFQLLVDARNDDAVERLRTRKHREEKPFALMYPSLEFVKQACQVSEIEERLLLSPEAPIVLLKSLTSTSVGGSIAPRNPYLGIMLPYSPLHHVLMRELSFPVVATSGNMTDEPICVDEHDALERLRNIADLFLVHNRPIERQVDDSVSRIMAGRTQLVRRARGFAPLPIEMDLSTESTILAVGGHLKNAIALNSGRNIFISQHIGDLSAGEAYDAFRKVNLDFRKLYGLSPALIVHDNHPDYLSTQYAAKQSEEKLGVQHHLAHVAACMAENKLEGPVLGISWDGSGYGEDGTIWGGEFLLTDGLSYDRIATFRSFRLPGGDASIKEPRRTAVGVLYEILGDDLFETSGLNSISTFKASELIVIKKMLVTRLNSPLTTSAGRIFDAVSSIAGIRQTASFEGQAAMELEFAAEGVKCEGTYQFNVMPGMNSEVGDRESDEANISGDRYVPHFIIDWETMIRNILEEVSSGVEIGIASAKFHNTLVRIILEVAKRAGKEKIVLTGGCFQNKYLTERTVEELRDKGFKPYWHQRVPTNDGGIALGQIYVALKRHGSGMMESGVRNKMKSAESRLPIAES